MCPGQGFQQGRDRLPAGMGPGNGAMQGGWPLGALVFDTRAFLDQKPEDYGCKREEDGSKETHSAFWCQFTDYR